MSENICLRIVIERVHGPLVDRRSSNARHHLACLSFRHSSGSLFRVLRFTWLLVGASGQGLGFNLSQHTNFPDQTCEWSPPQHQPTSDWFSPTPWRTGERRSTAPREGVEYSKNRWQPHFRWRRGFASHFSGLFIGVSRNWLTDGEWIHWQTERGGIWDPGPSFGNHGKAQRRRWVDKRHYGDNINSHNDSSTQTRPGYPTPRKNASQPCGHLDFESAVTAQNDEFKAVLITRLHLSVETQEREPRDSILTVVSIRTDKCICCNINCAEWKRSLHTRWRSPSYKWPWRWTLTNGSDVRYVFRGAR